MGRQKLVEGEEEVVQLQVGQEAMAEEVGEVDHLQRKEEVVVEAVVVVLPCCRAKGEGEVVLVVVEVPRGPIGKWEEEELVEVQRSQEQEGEEVEEEVVPEALRQFQLFYLVR